MRKGEFKRESAILAKVDATPRPGSGNTIGAPEDGANSWGLFQSKRTDKKSISLCWQDVADLTYHAGLEYRLPVFLLTVGDETLLCLREHHIPDFLQNAEVRRWFLREREKGDDDDK